MGKIIEENGIYGGRGILTNTLRIAKNTFFLYFRQILIMLISLYTVRVVLATLGAEDYGIYNVVAGVVVMFGFLSGAMATASQRFFSFWLGRGDSEKLRKTFSVTVCIYLILILIVVVLAETAGLWLVKNKLVIPAERMFAAIWAYQFSIANFAVTLMAAPYMAAIIAHEDMGVYAYASIAEAALKLASVFLLKIIPYDKMAVYGALLLCVGIATTSIYRLYCRRCYEECAFRLVWDGAMFREIVGYMGWNLFGSASWIIKNQGCAVLLNLFIGPAVNAAQGVASSVKNAVSVFSSNFLQAVRPQIVKSYSVEDYDNLWKTVYFGCKSTYFLLLVIVVPLFFNVEYILSLWLGEIPKFTVPFVQLLLIEVLVQSFGEVLATVNQATGKIALYQFIIGSVIFFNLPVSYLFLKLGFSPCCVYFVGIVSVFCMTAVRLFFLFRIPGFSFKLYSLHVLFPISLSTVILFSIVHFIRICADSFLSLTLDIFFKFLISCTVIFFTGFSASERMRVWHFFRKFLKKWGMA